MGPTGPIESWTLDVHRLGPIYPFLGWEWVTFALSAAFCVWFLIWKLSTETAKYNDLSRRYSTGEGPENETEEKKLSP
ncbi:MAG: hypothetical protein QF408_00755 [Pirellulales bacterium]|jgi:hypothetical protein|nr:hypothetical protein [Pirellulales bacterium]HJN66708.1 hypothetical protein [Pirellulales bacterium]|tara:strand:+ start:84 stop:317 length:234 start_codon:yes stop_codon:yes gene_type:complete